MLVGLLEIIVGICLTYLSMSPKMRIYRSRGNGHRNNITHYSEENHLRQCVGSIFFRYSTENILSLLKLSTSTRHPEYLTYIHHQHVFIWNILQKLNLFMKRLKSWILRFLWGRFLASFYLCFAFSYSSPFC